MHVCAYCHGVERQETMVYSSELKYWYHALCASIFWTKGRAHVKQPEKDSDSVSENI